MKLARLPGADLVWQGLDDAAAGRVTVHSCLISIARPRLESAGLLSHYPLMHFVPEPERALYRLLVEEGGDAYSRYNSLLRRLVSFERSLTRLRGAETLRIGTEQMEP